MTRWVLLLRGINVGGHGKLPMARLRELADQAGLGDPRTYIQSGNLVVTSDLDEAGVLAALGPLLDAELGRPIALLARSLEQWQTIISGTPFPDPDPPKSVHAWLFAGAPDAQVRQQVTDLVERQGTTEQIGWGERELYLSTPSGFGISRVAERLPRALAKDDPGTARNWASMLAIEALATHH